MKYAALGKSIPKRPSSWDNEQTPILERGSTLSSELCRVELGEAGEGAGLVPPGSSPRSHPPSRAPGPAGDALTGVPGFCTPEAQLGRGDRSLPLTKAPSRVKTSYTPSVIKGPICPFSLTVLQTQASSHRSQEVSSPQPPCPEQVPPISPGPHTWPGQPLPPRRPIPHPPGFHCRLRLVCSDHCGL